ncbi:MAG: protease inhibitor Inh/omp19 family protein [Rhizobiaceae bacterium]|nr:protease inhibitor Inh/omp19 family protein [Rhizobiaceae bacterium]MCV0404636.1 protease inhibitor Inh/omp19 family protein [Rhizobiaceae bacterium]
MINRILLATALAALVAAAGCQGSRMSSVNTRPAPLPAAPAGTVTNEQLPPPGSAGAEQFPDAPQAPNEQVAALDPEQQAAAEAAAPEITAGSVAGVWNVDIGGQSCRVATPQTKFGAGFRAGPLRCPAPVDGVKSWNVSGKQLALYDQNGSVLARLYQSGTGRFDGQTTSGQPISLSR